MVNDVPDNAYIIDQRLNTRAGSMKNTWTKTFSLMPSSNIEFKIKCPLIVSGMRVLFVHRCGLINCVEGPTITIKKI